MSARSWLLRVAITCAAMAAAIAAGAPSGAAVEGGATADTLTRPFVGDWYRLDGAPSQLRIEGAEVGIWFSIADSLQGIAYVAEDGLVGLAWEMSRNGGNGETEPREPRAIRISETSNGTLRFAILSAWEPCHAETVRWTRREKTGPIVTLPAIASQDAPPLGQYVYTDVLPVKVKHVQPQYPTLARSLGVSGTVMVQALVGRDGRVIDVRIVNSIPALDAAALHAVKQWEFVPAQSEGKPVAVWVGCPVKFSLR